MRAGGGGTDCDDAEETQMTGYSADVNLWLACGNDIIPLSHTSSTFVIARPPAHLEPCDATIVVEIDGDRFETPVVLPDGMNMVDRQTKVVKKAQLLSISAV